MKIEISKPIIGYEEVNAVTSVLLSGKIAAGEVVKKLEEEFAKYCGTKYAIAVNSGTAAIHAGLNAIGIKEGDEVITTPFTFVSTASPVVMQGGKLVFADIREDDFCIDAKEIERKISKKTKAIIAVDLYGQIYDYEGIKVLADRHNLKILEDACQAVGAIKNGKKAGNFGDLAAFSFYATKNIMCGEGGIIVTNDDNIFESCKSFRHHGQIEGQEYRYNDLGYNYRLTDLAASIAIEQLKKVEDFNKKRIKNATKLKEGLKNIKGLILPESKNGDQHVFNHFTVRITEEFKIKRDELMESLRQEGINCGIYYKKPLHLHPAFKNMGYKKGDFPVAEKIAKEVISIPVHPLLGEEEIDYVVKNIRKYGE